MRAILILVLLALPASAQTLTGDWNGARSSLEAQGLQLGADEIADVLGNVAGGTRQGAAAEGRLEIFANVDLAQVLGWKGAFVRANAYQIHGKGLTATRLNNLVAVSNIESAAGTRLFALWFQQSLFQDSVSLRLGQIAADDEFFVSQYAPLFINSTFGWPSILGINLPGGGPAYASARPGARLRVALTPQLVWSVALFSGDPRSDVSGLNLRFGGGAFAISEISYGLSVLDLPGSLKLGAWYHSGQVQDQRFDAGGISQAVSGGDPALRRGDYGGYAIWDQLLVRNSGTSDSGLGAFIRAGLVPPGRNLIAFHLDGGLSYAAPFGREGDLIGVAMSLEQVSDSRRDVTGDFRKVTGLATPLPDFESALELSWQAQVTPWWIVQPDLQWVIHPGGRVLDPAHPLAVTPDALVLGLRTAVAL